MSTWNRLMGAKAHMQPVWKKEDWEPKKVCTMVGNVRITADEEGDVTITVIDSGKTLRMDCGAAEGMSQALHHVTSLAKLF